MRIAQRHIDYVIAVFGELAEECETAKGLRMVCEPPCLRHFTARFGPC
jgi:tryptophanase